MSAYSQASKDVFDVFHDTSPLVEGISIDEAFLEVGGLAKIVGNPLQIGANLRRDVAEQVGLPITVGIARTKFLAKVASAFAKPDGLLRVPPEGETEFLHPLPVEKLWGVGKITAQKLRNFDIVTVGDIARHDESSIVSILGAAPVAISTHSHTIEIRAPSAPIVAAVRWVLSMRWVADPIPAQNSMRR